MLLTPHLWTCSGLNHLWSPCVFRTALGIGVGALGHFLGPGFRPGSWFLPPAPAASSVFRPGSTARGQVGFAVAPRTTSNWTGGILQQRIGAFFGSKKASFVGSAGLFAGWLAPPRQWIHSTFVFQPHQRPPRGNRGLTALTRKKKRLAAHIYRGMVEEFLMVRMLRSSA